MCVCVGTFFFNTDDSIKFLYLQIILTDEKLRKKKRKNFLAPTKITAALTRGQQLNQAAKSRVACVDS